MSAALFILLRGLAHRVLEPRLGSARSRRAVERAQALAEQDPAGEACASGARIVLKMAALAGALHRALQEEGLCEEDARALTAEVSWAVYRRMGAVPWGLARLSSVQRLERLQAATEAFRHWPSGPPDYRMEDRPAGVGEVAFDVLACPVAAYFRSHDQADLCVAAFCDLDYRLAPRWGARLERTSTLAAGADCCDFRWKLTD